MEETNVMINKITSDMNLQINELNEKLEEYENDIDGLKDSLKREKQAKNEKMEEIEALNMQIVEGKDDYNDLMRKDKEKENLIKDLKEKVQELVEQNDEKSQMDEALIKKL